MEQSKNDRGEAADMGDLMGKLRGFVADKERKLVRCMTCWKKYTKFMSIKLYQHKEDYKCIRCYNGGTKQWQK